MRTRTKVLAAAGATAILAIVAFAAWFLLIRGDGPDAATSTSAVAAAQEQRAASGQPITTPEAAPGSDTASAVVGDWQLDTTFGDNTFPFTGSSYVGYRVVEELATIGAFTAVGRTTTVSGSLTIDETQITAVDVVADLTRLKSDSSSRDEVIRSQALESSTFPEARFTLSEPIELGEIPDPDTTISVQAVGELTLHGGTNAVTVPLEATLVGGDTIAVVGTVPVVFSDYDIDPPSAAIVVAIEDEGEMELQLFFTR